LLIIFDLDDTLIDTSGCVTPVKLEDALHRMVEAGLVVPDFSSALELLKRLNERALSARFALSEFLEIQGYDRRFLEIGVQEVYHNISPDLSIFAFDGVQEGLAELAAFHQLVCVTIGVPDQQLSKMKKAGIDSRIFSKIIVSEEKNKKVYYRAILEEFQKHPSDVVVCGDRISIDLTPAKELGMKTVHIRKGRGLHLAGSAGDVDFSIKEFSEMKEIINALAMSSSL
jgi:FMN phosphatase YigB (HAD superfamily)